jgi:hypothetical protein
VLQHKELQDDSNIINYTRKNLNKREQHEESLQDHNEKDFVRYHSPMTIFFLSYLIFSCFPFNFFPFPFFLFFFLVEPTALHPRKKKKKRKINICI